MERLKDKVVIVTGSSSGFGRAIAVKFAKEGAKMVCSDIRREPKEGGYEKSKMSTDELIKENGGEAIFVKCDVTKPEEVKSLVNAAVDKFGRLNIMVNNAGVYPPGGVIHERPETDLESAFAVNVMGVWNGSKQAINQFLEQGGGGNIINIVSIAGLYGWANSTAYNASKGAAKQITESLAIDYGPHGIRVNAICPGFAPTALSRENYENLKVRQKVIDDTPLGNRWTSSEDVANVAVFLGSDESEFLTGTFHVVDGGYSLRYAHSRGLFFFT